MGKYDVIALCLYITPNGSPVLGLLATSFAEIDSETGFLVSLTRE